VEVARERTAALANSGFRRLWLAQGISIFGDYLAMFALQSAIVFRMHGSPREVSAVLLVSLLPAILIGPVAGVFADRWNPRRTMVLSDALRAVLVLLLAALLAMWTRSASAEGFLVRICMLCFGISSVSALFVPAQAVLIPQLVPREELLAASVRMQQTMHVARIASPAVAGALVARFGETACYGADAASFIFSAVMLATIPCAAPHLKAAGKTCSREAFLVMREICEGIGFLLANSEVLFATLAMAAGTFAAGCYSALAAIYVRDTLYAGTGMYGAMGSLTAAGTLAGTLAIGRLAKRLPRQLLIALGMGVVGLCILGLAILPAIPIAMVAAAGIGLGAALAMVAAATVLKERTPAELRGRVSSVSMSLMSAAQAGAMALAGSAAAWMGARGVYALSAAMLLAQPFCLYFRRETSRSTPSACFQTPR
jgi:MFS family permease